MNTGIGVKVIARVMGVGLAANLLAAPASAAPPSGVPSDNGNAGIQATLTEINNRLIEIQKRLACPVDEFLNGACGSTTGTANPGQDPDNTTVQYCISQGRQFNVEGKYSVEPGAEVEAGAGWPEVAWAKVTGKVGVPLAVPVGDVPLPIPTELAVAGAGNLGKGFQICVQIPMQAATTDAVGLKQLVQSLNTDGNKYQKRLSRLVSYASRRTAPSTAAKASLAGAATEDDLAALDTAVDNFMAGQFDPTSFQQGPLGLFKDPSIQAARNLLDLPEPVQKVLDDPDGIFGALPAAFVDNPGQMCNTLGLSGSIAGRSPAIATTCNALNSLPSFATVTSAFGKIDAINALIPVIPDQVALRVKDILPDALTPTLPPPPPSTSVVCKVFPRLC
jgi:hypothetical protein